MGSSRYPVPTNAVFVAPNGSDVGAGTKAAPYRTLAAAIAKSPTGQTIVLRAGVYHESVTIPEHKRVTVQPSPGEEVWFDGSTPLTTWSPDGAVWSSPYSSKFDASPTFSRGSFDGSDPGWVFVSKQFPMASHPDQVFVDGAAQRQVGSRAEVVPGSFYADYATGRLFLGTNPAGHAVRASDLVQAFLVVSPGSTLRGFGVRRYAPSVPDFGAVSVRRPGVSLEELTVQDSATVGVSVITTAATLDRVTVIRSGMLGIHANRADNIIIKNARVEGNNSERFNMAPVAGGLKITQTRNVSVIGGTYAGNFGDGIWFDQSVYNMNVTSADLRDNKGHGVQFELSAKFVVADCLVTGNGKTGILVRGSDDGRIWNNTVAGNVESNINILQDGRTPTNTSYGQDRRQPFPDPTMTWVITHVQIKNNVNVSPAESATGALVFRDQSGRSTTTDMHPDVDGNLYQRSAGAQTSSLFRWVANGAIVTAPDLDKFRSATGYDPQSDLIEGDAVITATGALTTGGLAASAGSARPLPGDVAALINQSAGTARMGAWR